MATANSAADDGRIDDAVGRTVVITYSVSTDDHQAAASAGSWVLRNLQSLRPFDWTEPGIYPFHGTLCGMPHDKDTSYQGTVEVRLGGQAGGMSSAY